MKVAIILALLCATACFAEDYDEQSIQYDKIFGGDAYQQQSGETKMNMLWQEVTRNTTSFGYYANGIAPSLFVEQMPPTFDWAGDTMPPTRRKLIHTTGVVAKAKFVATPGSPYTGNFQGSDTLLVRLSSVFKPHTTFEYKHQNGNQETVKIPHIYPSIAMKFLVDGQPAAHIEALYSNNGQPSYNFFLHELSNHIPAPSGTPLELLGDKFATLTCYIEEIGLLPVASVTPQGTTVENPVFPYQLFFRPNSELTEMYSNSFETYFTEQISALPAGTTFYDVYALEQPYSQPELIGHIQSVTQFTPSNFGDIHLFFKHNLMPDDIALHPEWAAYAPTYHRCPFTIIPPN